MAIAAANHSSAQRRPLPAEPGNSSSTNVANAKATEAGFAPDTTGAGPSNTREEDPANDEPPPPPYVQE